MLRWKSASLHPQAICLLPRYARILKPGTYGCL